jgi:hypothetical protein
MTDRAISEAAMLSGLRDITLPAEGAGGALAEVCIAMGLAGAAAWGVVAILRLFSQRVHAQTAATLGDQLANLDLLPEPERRIRLLHLLRAHAPLRYAQIAGNLYAPQGAVPTATLEAEMARLV